MHSRRHPPRLVAFSIRETSPRPRIGLNYIAWKLGRDRDSDDGSVIAASTRSLVRTIRTFVDKAGFPPPLAPHARRGQVLQGPDAVHKHAVWDKLAVDQWFDRPTLPPAAFAAPANDTAGAFADALDARAASL